MIKLIATTVFALALVAPTSAQEGLVTRPSKYSVAETIDRLESAVKSAREVQIFARIDYQAMAATQGGKIRPSQLLIFGRGGQLPQLLPNKPIVAIDLPPRALAWEDESGKVWLTYITGDFLKSRHGIEGKDDVMKRLTGFTRSLVEKALE